MHYLSLGGETGEVIIKEGIVPSFIIRAFGSFCGVGLVACYEFFVPVELIYLSSQSMWPFFVEGEGDM